MMDIKEIKRLIALVESANISHLGLESKGTKIEIKKELNTSPPVPIQTQATIQAIPTQEAPKEAAKQPDNIKAITAEMVGTFYSKANPDATDYVSVGSKIKKGDTICILEAMKLFNEIESEIAGTITKICVQNGSPVEFGQELFLVDVDG